MICDTDFTRYSAVDTFLIDAGNEHIASENLSRVLLEYLYRFRLANFALVEGFVLWIRDIESSGSELFDTCVVEGAISFTEYAVCPIDAQGAALFSTAQLPIC